MLTNYTTDLFDEKPTIFLKFIEISKTDVKTNVYFQSLTNIKVLLISGDEQSWYFFWFVVDTFCVLSIQNNNLNLDHGSQNNTVMKAVIVFDVCFIIYLLKKQL